MGNKRVHNPAERRGNGDACPDETKMPLTKFAQPLGQKASRGLPILSHKGRGGGATPHPLAERQPLSAAARAGGDRLFRAARRGRAGVAAPAARRAVAGAGFFEAGDDTTISLRGDRPANRAVQAPACPAARRPDRGAVRSLSPRRRAPLSGARRLPRGDARTVQLARQPPGLPRTRLPPQGLLHGAARRGPLPARLLRLSALRAARPRDHRDLPQRGRRRARARPAQCSVRRSAGALSSAARVSVSISAIETR